MNIKKTLRNIRWLGHGGCLISEKPITYIDPYKLGFPDVGDLILITSSSEHHCSPDMVKWLRKGATVIIAPEGCSELFHGGDVHTANPSDHFEVKGAHIDVVPAYADEESKKSGKFTGVGYILSFPSGLVLYHSGHTIIVPELPVESVDIFLLLMGEHSGLDIPAAAKLIDAVGPTTAIPLHWDDGSMDMEGVKKLNDLCEAEVSALKAKP